MDEIQLLIDNELERATNKFGAFHSPHEGIAVLWEEFLELRNAVFWGHNPAEVTKEAVQVAAMAKRFIKDCCDGRMVGSIASAYIPDSEKSLTVDGEMDPPLKDESKRYWSVCRCGHGYYVHDVLGHNCILCHNMHSECMGYNPEVDEDDNPDLR
jgi:hypothetical protein